METDELADLLANDFPSDEKYLQDKFVKADAVDFLTDEVDTLLEEVRDALTLSGSLQSVLEELKLLAGDKVVSTDGQRLFLVLKEHNIVLSESQI